ncbi:unnamed protein product [Didymodactylos carnosus]|uniref:Minor histocompatibility antigen H13 n=1 Tax=Didymodactylos carnosus TaxID=1234261 RepID=A0A814MV92_9BILA|nr:unnamed protein product [Didymodactylos carnosus]CAF1084407.1 unnamed protein product [Didymodactylos carnosus]CAF3549454.1 unnamed protein product [Didymodactylos carnosus]CAF3850044.1 unnamed protein product [Didymodactylos carnosus]
MAAEQDMDRVTISPILDTIDIINNTLSSNLTNGSNATKETPFVARTDGMLLSYSFLLLSALLCVYVGSYRSIIRKNNQEKSGEKPDVLTAKDAAMFPFIASGFLFGIYVVILMVSKEYITFVLNIYFFLIGVVALYRALQPVLKSKTLFNFHFLNQIKKRQFHVTLFENTQQQTEEKEKHQTPPTKGNKLIESTTATVLSSTIHDKMHLDLDFDLVDVGIFFVCALVGVWYLLKRHWIANNIFGIAFSINAIEILHFNKVLNGCVLLSGLFVYDIFWVFGTNVMITVAKSFDAPIKLIFPQDLIENGLFSANKFAMLGLGDIVVPGAFIALLLRYDMTRRTKNGSALYFNVSFVAYIIALVVTVLILQIFKHGQPALLYIVPLCLIFPLFTALVKNDLKPMFAYEDHPTTDEKNSALQPTTTTTAAGVSDPKRKNE